MDKKPSFWGALAIGLFFTILQVITFFIRFDQINSASTISDYIFFFVAGSIIGIAFIYLLRRSRTIGVFRAVVIAFALGIPFALFGMVMGGILGGLGVIFFSLSPSVFIMLIGYFLGGLFAKK